MNQLVVGPASPVHNYAAISPATTESTFAGSPTHLKHEDGSPGLETAKKKQKRNKPTLSCEECVERKTKVSDISIPRFYGACGPAVHCVVTRNTRGPRIGECLNL